MFKTMNPNYKSTQDALKFCIRRYMNKNKLTDEAGSALLGKKPGYLFKAMEEHRTLGMQTLAVIGEIVPFPKVLLEQAHVEYNERMVIRGERIKLHHQGGQWFDTVERIKKHGHPPLSKVWPSDAPLAPRTPTRAITWLSLVEAMQDQPTPPCAGCPNYDLCAKYEMSCEQFAYYLGELRLDKDDRRPMEDFNRIPNRMMHKVLFPENHRFHGNSAAVKKALASVAA